MIAPADERAHVPGTSDGEWHEAWFLDVVDGGGDCGLTVGFVLWPWEGRVGFHASVVRRDQPLISLVEAEIRAPNPPSLEVRAPGLWTEIGIQVPLDHVTVDLESFAVELDDPDDVFRGAFGRRMALGCELEWETAAEIETDEDRTSYSLGCEVHGELLIDDEVIEIDGWGWRSHSWGSSTIGDPGERRGRTRTSRWFRSTAGDPAPLSIIGSAPVPDFGGPPDARLDQQLIVDPDGAVAWWRRRRS